MDTFSLRLQMVDDDGDVVHDETRTDLSCNRRIRQQKFMVTYEVENCAGSEAPGANSNGSSDTNGKSKSNSTGEITVTATTEDGELIASRILKCNK